MKAGSFMLLAALVVLTLALLPWSVQRWNLASAQEAQAELTRTHAALASDLNHLRAQLHSAEIVVAKRAARIQAPDDGHYYVAVPKELIKSTGLFFLSDYQLTPDAIGLLGLTADETSALNNLLMELKTQVQARLLATAHELEPARLLSLVGHPIFDQADANEQIAAYLIPPLRDDESAELRERFAEGVAKILDPDRAELFMAQMLLNVSDIKNGQSWVLAVRLGKMTASDKARFAYGPVPRNSNPMQMTSSSEGMPSRWAFLFEGDGALTLPPALNESP